jgi:predicted lipid-binding transport protein (Tim44 family)
LSVEKQKDGDLYMKKSIFKKCRAMLAVVAVSVLGFGALPDEAYAKRMGGGSGVGKTAPSYSRQATPSSPSATPNSPAPSKATNPSNATNPAGAAAQPQRNRFLGPLMGLAAGLGLAALFSHLGLGEGMANMMGMLLLVGIAVFLIRKLFVMMRGQQQAQPRPAYGMAGDASAGAGAYKQEPQMPQSMNKDSLFGNPSSAAAASADPRAAFDHAPLEPNQSALVKQLPAGFDEAGFVSNAKKFFTTMQGMYDKADLAGLREYCSDEAFNQLSAEIRARGTEPNKTEVLMLNAELIGFERDGDEELASVSFTGMLREQADAAAENLHEMWVMSRPVAGGGWVLAGIHSL